MARFGFIVLICLLGCPSVHAEWHKVSLSLLHGDNFKLSSDPQVSTLTAEHVSGWDWGDTFAFVDILEADGSDTSYYFEVSPRVKLFDIDSIVSAAYLATTYEQSRSGYRGYLMGPGVDLKLPGFKFFQTALYKRHVEHQQGDSYQMTVVWNYPFKIAQSDWTVKGFADWIFDNHTGMEPNLHLVPQVLWHANNALNITKGQLYFGTEIDFWWNKFGVRDGSLNDSHQRAINLMVTYSF